MVARFVTHRSRRHLDFSGCRPIDFCAVLVEKKNVIPYIHKVYNVVHVIDEQPKKNMKKLCTKLRPILFETAQSLTDHHAKHPAYSCAALHEGKGKKEKCRGKKKKKRKRSKEEIWPWFDLTHSRACMGYCHCQEICFIRFYTHLELVEDFPFFSGKKTLEGGVRV